MSSSTEITITGIDILLHGIRAEEEQEEATKPEKKIILLGKPKTEKLRRTGYSNNSYISDAARRRFDRRYSSRWVASH